MTTSESDAQPATLTIHPDGTATLTEGGRPIDAHRHVTVDDPDSPHPFVDLPAWDGPAQAAGQALAPGKYTAHITELDDTDPYNAGYFNPWTD